MSKTLLTTKDLSTKIQFSSGYINRVLRDTVFLEGIHYIRPFGGRKIFYIWEAIEKELFSHTVRPRQLIPMAAGRLCHG
ncbi:Transcription-repair coupling factor [Rheinheimera salexigens]|uniref:Transcription-repair coupling factor n=1 Tax=Rheinheimera salexigens TaxID=1628148 RepID=A0A1E7Q745_9GAMM|nr:hypothetical protein BI198_10885 [Rheinheimera salexigens]